MKRRFFWIFYFALLASTASINNAAAAGCDPQFISMGATTAAVRTACGEPDWREHWKEGHRVNTAPGKHPRRSVSIEEWVYNFGPSTFIRIFRFEEGHLAEIKTGGYGFSQEAPSDLGCERTIVSPGETKWEVRMKCGEPTGSEGRGRKDHPVRSWRKSDEWIYNLGPSRLVRIFRFQNGRLIKIETGNYGR